MLDEFLMRYAETTHRSAGDSNDKVPFIIRRPAGNSKAASGMTNNLCPAEGRSVSPNLTHPRAPL
jgi:hypothetical protein